MKDLTKPKKHFREKKEISKQQSTPYDRIHKHIDSAMKELTRHFQNQEMVRKKGFPHAVRNI